MNFPAQARTQAVPGRCALIVDADPQVTSALGSVFEPEQWAILHAPDNREALKLAEARAFDLIITGAKSTGKEDIDLLRKIRDRKSTRLNSSHGYISYAVFCLKKKKNHIRLRLQLRAIIYKCR